MLRRDGHAPAAQQPQRTFDGIICFGGEDWWYHNRGHYDMQMMREFSGRVPVLYVNSLGMRIPRVGEGAMFWKRVLRKWKSVRRGLVKVRESFWVTSPLSLPRLSATPIGRWLLAAQVRRAARRCGMRNPLIWVACPPAADVIDRVPHAGVVYQRTDRFEAFPGVDEAHILRCDSRLKHRADVSLFCSSLLFDAERDGCRSPLFVDHGVDYERFADAGARNEEPVDVRDIPRPRVGFVGGIDRHTFDPELFVQVVARMTDVSFVLVGGCTLGEGWCRFPHVHLLGQRPYDQVAAYMAACDVLIMPWNDSPWIRACNPVKLKEYLAVGRPIVTRGFAELRRYPGLVRVAETPDAFVGAITDALRQTCDAERLRRRVRGETWTAKAAQVLACLSAQGLQVDSDTART